MRAARIDSLIRFKWKTFSNKLKTLNITFQRSWRFSHKCIGKKPAGGRREKKGNGSRQMAVKRTRNFANYTHNYCKAEI